MRTPNFTGMPNLEYLNLEECTSLEEIHHSLKCCGKLIWLNLESCQSLERFPYVNVESLEYLNLQHCSSLEKFPEILGRMKPELEIRMQFSWIRELPSSIFQHQAPLTELDLGDMKNLVALPSSICKLKGLVKLDVSECSKLESLPEEIGALENLEEIHASYTLISRPPSSIVRLNKLRFLSFAKQKSEVGLEDEVSFVFPPVAEGLHSLKILNLRYCNLIDGGLPEDIGCLSSLEVLNLSGNNFEHLPRSMAHLGALRFLELINCKRLTKLPEFPQQLDTIDADWNNDSICNLLFHNISSLQRGICASDSLSLRAFTTRRKNIPSWFHHRGIGRSVSVNLLENWYVSDKFSGFAVCYSGKLIDTTAKLIPLRDDGMSWMMQKFALSNHSKSDTRSTINFFLVPLAGLWDTSKANRKTPNDYGLIRLYFSGEIKKFGFRLLYKDEPELEATRRSRYDDTEHHDEATCSRYYDSEKLVSGSFVFANLQQQVEAPVNSETLQLFPTSPGF